MTTETTLAQFVQERFGGVITAGAHNPALHEADCPACILEALNACHEREWSDSPQVARTFDIRPINDAPWSSDAMRTRYMVELGSLIDGSLDWPRERQQHFVEQVIRETIRQIIAELPSLSNTIRQRCRDAMSLGECRAATNAAAYDYAAAHAATAAATTAANAAVYAARAAAHAANAAVYAADAATRAAAYAAADSVYAAARADYAAAESILITACQIWIDAARTSGLQS